MNEHIELPCFKCAKKHPDNWVCEYNLTYQRWLLDELARVARALKSKEINHLRH